MEVSGQPEEDFASTRGIGNYWFSSLNPVSRQVDNCALLLFGVYDMSTMYIMFTMYTYLYGILLPELNILILIFFLLYTGEQDLFMAF